MIVATDKNMDYYERLCTIPEFTYEFRQERNPLKNLLEKTFTPRHPFLRVIFIIETFTYSLSVLMTIHLLLTTFDYANLLKYGAFMGVHIFFIENLYILLYLLDQVYEWGEKLEAGTFAFELSDCRYFSKDSVMVKLLKLVISVNFVLATITCIGLLLSQDTLREMIYLRAWICQQYSPAVCSASGYILSTLDFPVTCSIVTIPFIMVYYEVTDIVHINYLNELVKEICSSHLPEKELYNSELFQRMVTQKMKICVMIHNSLIQLSIEGTSMIYTASILICVGSLIIGTSMLLFLLSYDFNQVNYFVIGLVSATVNYLVCVWLYIQFSQLLKNESESTYYLLTQLPWYCMNKENRGIFSTFLRKSEKPISCAIDLFEVNYVLVMRIFKTLYSVAAIIARFQPQTH